MQINKWVLRTLLVTFLNLCLTMGLTATLGSSTAHAQAGYSPAYSLLKAIRKVDYREIKKLVQQGVNINTRDYEDQATPLVIAARMKQAPMVNYLLQNGAKPNLYGKNGKTALLIASENGDRVMVSVLLKAGADMNLSDDNGTTPLMAAVLFKKDPVVKLLLSVGADYELEDYTGRSALQHAIDIRRRRTEKMLRDAGATQ